MWQPGWQPGSVLRRLPLSCPHHPPRRAKQGVLAAQHTRPPAHSSSAGGRAMRRWRRAVFVAVRNQGRVALRGLAQPLPRPSTSHALPGYRRRSRDCPHGTAVALGRGAATVDRLAHGRARTPRSALAPLTAAAVATTALPGAEDTATSASVWVASIAASVTAASHLPWFAMMIP